MMDAELYAKLSGDTAIAALVDDAIYAMIAPKEATGRYLVWQRISGVPEPMALDAENAVSLIRVQIDSYGDSYGDARGLADTVKAALRDWRPTGGVIGHVMIENDRAIRENDPALMVFRVSQDYMIATVE